MFLAAVIAIVWIPFSRSIYGRAAYSIGSAQSAAFMSGLPIRRAQLLAYALAGLLSGVAGLYLTFFSYTGEAAYASGNAYTLYSIASVVLGGVSLAGGRGSLIGAVFGALAFRTIGDLLFIFNFDPLWQPLFQGFVLLVAVSLSSVELVARPQPARVVRMNAASAPGRTTSGRRLSASIPRSPSPTAASSRCC